MSGVFDLEYTALKKFIDAEKIGRESGVSMWFTGLNPSVKAVVQRSPLGEVLGRERMLHNLEEAVAKYRGEQVVSAPTVEAEEPEPVLVG